jgi:hypothetical protein
MCALQFPVFFQHDDSFILKHCSAIDITPDVMLFVYLFIYSEFHVCLQFIKILFDLLFLQKFFFRVDIRSRICFPFVVCGCETWTVTVREEGGGVGNCA